VDFAINQNWLDIEIRFQNNDLDLACQDKFVAYFPRELFIRANDPLLQKQVRYQTTRYPFKSRSLKRWLERLKMCIIIYVTIGSQVYCRQVRPPTTILNEA
jgi:hypothetical protein